MAINKLTDVNVWQSFVLTDLFEIKGTKTTSLLELQEYGVGQYPYVTTQATKNGVDGFYNYWTEEGGVLTVDSAVLGYCTYQKFDFSSSDHVEKLVPKFEMNTNIALFIVALMNKEQYRYNYGRKASQDRLKSRSIKLPVNADRLPNWEYMNSFVDSHTRSYDGARKPALSNETPAISTDEWKHYKLQDIFDIFTGKDLIYNSSNGTEYPVIGHGVANNGVATRTEYLPDYPLFDHTKTISLADRGNFFATIQAEDFYLGTRTKALVSKYSDVPKEALLFVCTVINREAFRFNYGRVASSRTHALEIKLPSRNDKPNWSFMTTFMKTLSYSSSI